MGAVVIRSHGGPEVLEWAELPRPVPESDEVLVKVAACGINHLDLWTRRGERGVRVEFPHALGSDAAGTVAEIGSDVERLREGDRVLIAPGFLQKFHADRSGFDAKFSDYRVLGHGSPGGYAEYVKAREENVVKISKRWSFEEWAATPLVFLTAWHMLAGRAKLRPGETVLVIAGGSGVGSAAIQIARHFGCRVIATAGSEAKLQKALELGAHEGVNHYEANWPERVRRLTDGVDVVVEHVGGEAFSKAVTTLRYGGRLVTCGATTLAEGRIHLLHLFAKQLSILGSYMGSFREFLDVLALLEAGCLRPVVDRVYPIRESAKAHRRLEASEHFGKIVLKHG
jgi:NADPH:quinone reductase-like Zn-dependent oxidoreductase